MISSTLSRTGAAFFLFGGIVLLFASDVALPTLVPGFPPRGAWIGQLLGASWLGLAALNWYSRTALLGGIYGRRVVLANAVTYFVSAITLLRVAPSRGAPTGTWPVAVLATLLALAYMALLFKGPLDPLDSPPR